MFTRHGHHIPGTVKDSNPPGYIPKKCGGVNHCEQCTGEWERWFMSDKINFVGEVEVRGEVNELSIVVGTAKVEKTKSGSLAFHVKMHEGYEDYVTIGFKIGDFSVMQDSQ